MVHADNFLLSKKVKKPSLNALRQEYGDCLGELSDLNSTIQERNARVDKRCKQGVRGLVEQDKECWVMKEDAQALERRIAKATALMEEGKKYSRALEKFLQENSI